MTSFELRLAKLEESLETEQRKNAVLTYFVFKYLDDIYKKSEIEGELLNLGFHNRAELAALVKDKDPNLTDILAKELDTLAKLYKRINK